MHWLELFFDLVMVAYIGRSRTRCTAIRLGPMVSIFFAFLAAAWWAWVNATVTMNLFGARVTPSIWVAVTIAMIAIGVMAAAVPEALTERAAAFASATPSSGWSGPGRGCEAPHHRRAWWRPVLYCWCRRRSGWCPSGCPPWQYVLWGFAVAIEIMLLSFLGGQRTWLRQALDVDHLIERVGLLVVIVFGESILAIIAELDAHWTVLSGGRRAGVRRVSMLAWIFFGYATAAVERGLRRLQLRGSVGGLRDTVMYLPFLLIAGIALFASGSARPSRCGHHLPIGAAVCLARASACSSSPAPPSRCATGRLGRRGAVGTGGVLRRGCSCRCRPCVGAELVVAASVVLIGVFVALNEINIRRVRARMGAAA